MKRMTTDFFRVIIVLLLMVGIYGTAPSAWGDDKSFEIYGFAQMDYIQDFNRVDPNWQATLRPSKIPTTQGQFGSDGQSILSARQSRLGAKANLPTDYGDVFTRVEFDFFGTGADAGQTTIRLRHAYGQWNQILGGQTNTLFMDGDIWPNVIDYWGPTGMVFYRNVQLRWTPVKGDTNFAVAIEHPTNDVDGGVLVEDDPNLGAVQPDQKLPDFTAQLRRNNSWGHMQLAGILRRLGYNTPGAVDNTPKGNTTGWGLDLTSAVKVRAKDQLLLGGVYGHGIANYMNDGGMDLAAQTNGPTGVEPAAVPLFGLLAYYDHWWNDKWSSTFGYSKTQVENTDLQTIATYHSGQYASGNVIYYPVKNVFFGAEFMWGERTDVSGAKGIDRRIQLSTNYKFSSADFFSKP